MRAARIAFVDLDPSIPSSPIELFLEQARTRPHFAQEQLTLALALANGNHSRNTYLVLDHEWTMAEGERQTHSALHEADFDLLRGVPVSLKDCFDLEGFTSSCGSVYYAQHRGVASSDSAVTARLKAAGAVIIGKTHMHQLAYGITGESRDYGNCLQPEDATALTGGSSSGAAASVQEGSALAAVGTDTGGSIRVPAALCGLAGFRCSHGLTDWLGAHHLAPSFDTAGWIFRDLRDSARLACALWGDGIMETRPLAGPVRVGVPAAAMLFDCEPAVLASFARWKDRLARDGAVLVEPDARFCDEAFAIFSPIQASEAAQIHAGLYENFEPLIAQRLAWGASLTNIEVARCREQQAAFLRQMRTLFAQCDFFLAPATPVARLDAGGDHSAARQRILRYTAPASVAGLPVAVLPGGRGGGMQLMASHGNDGGLLQYAVHLGRLLVTEQQSYF